MLVALPFLLSAAQAAAAPAPPAPTGHMQIFIAPSGEPFRVAGNAPYPVAQWFAGADKNGDGKLDKDEFVADFMRFFDQLDVDHDGAIDGAERSRYENEIAPETLGGSMEQRDAFAGEPDDSESGGEGASGDSEARKPRYGLNPTGAGRFDLFGMPEPVAAMDIELRGRITRRAAQQAAEDRFAMLDQLHRGYLTLDSLPPTYAQRGGHVGSGSERRARGGHGGHGGHGGGYGRHQG